MDELLGSRRVKPTPSAAGRSLSVKSWKSWNTSLERLFTIQVTETFPTSLFLLLLLQGLTLGLCDCSVNLPRRISDRVVIPLADAESLHVVWQNGDTIWSQKIDRDRCTNSGEPQVINRSESLPFPENGLSAAITAMQPGGRQLAIAWKDGNQLFLKLGDSSPFRFDTGAVLGQRKVILVETDQGVAIAWSTWQEGWVTHLRRCRAPLDCGPIFDLRQPNISLPSEWLPRMLSCQGALWALFVDGPMLHFLGYDSWSTGPVVDYHDEVISAALDCSGEEVVALWVEKNGTVQWRSVASPPPPLPPLPPSGLSFRPSSPSSPSSPSRSSSSNLSNLSLGFLPETLRTQDSLSVRRLGSPAVESQEIGPGEISVLAMNGYLLVVNNWPKLQVQLFNYAHPARYPVHGLAPGSRDVEVVMDCEGECRGAFICWSTGGVFGEDVSFQCTYRGLMGLMNVDGLGTAGQMVLVVMFSLLFLLCLLKQCSGGGGFRRRFIARTEEPLQRREREQRERHASELRSQLAQIPVTPLQGCEAPSTSPCPICQNEVQVRVALQRCGHTACRECTTRLVDLAQPCHICRAPIEGLQIVYI